MNCLLVKLLCLCTLAIVFSLAGCESSGGRRAVSGSITLKGSPVNSGTITFSLPESPAIPAATALVANGNYAIPADQGLMPGKYQVRISAPEAFDLTPEEYSAGKKIPPPVERIPAKYNTQTEQMVEVKTTGTNKFDYQIE